MAHEKISKQLTQMVRGVSVVISLALVSWSFYGGDLIGGGAGFGWTQGVILIGGIVLALSCLAKVNWNASVLAIYLSAGLTLLMAELLLRPMLGPRYFGVFELDPYYLYKPIPNVTREYNRQSVNKKGYIKYQINSDGFRGEEIVQGRDHTRIVIYGDSFIHAQFSVLKDTFAEQLEGKLTLRLGKDVEVINAGVAGYGPDQIIRRMEKELLWLEPDLIVVGVFAGNDYGDLIRNKLYKLDDNGELQQNNFIVSEEIKRKMALARGELLLKKILRDVARSVRLNEQRKDEKVQSGRKRVESFLKQNSKEFQEYIAEGDNIVRILASDPYNADVSLTPDSNSAVYKKKLMARVIERMKEITDNLSIPLVLLIIPHPMDVLNGVHDSGEVDRQAYPEYRPEALTNTLQRIADEHNIDSVNLFDIYQQRDAAQLYFSGGDDHWNELGQEVAAEEVTNYLISRELLLE